MDACCFKEKPQTEVYCKKKKKERERERKEDNIQSNNKSNFDKYVLSWNTKFSKLRKK